MSEDRKFARPEPALIVLLKKRALETSKEIDGHGLTLEDRAPQVGSNPGAFLRKLDVRMRY